VGKKDKQKIPCVECSFLRLTTFKYSNETLTKKKCFFRKSLSGLRGVKSFSQDHAIIAWSVWRNVRPYSNSGQRQPFRVNCWTKWRKASVEGLIEARIWRKTRRKALTWRDGGIDIQVEIGVWWMESVGITSGIVRSIFDTRRRPGEWWWRVQKCCER